MSILSEQPAMADVVIIGGGIMGLCTAYFLARQHVGKIVLIEKESQIGGVMTLRCGGGFRQQFASATNVRLSQLSLRLLQGLADEAGTPIPLQWTGYLFVLTCSSTALRFKDALTQQHEHGVYTEWLTPAETSRLLPRMQLDGIEGATFHARDGRIDPHLVVQLYQQQIQQANVIMLTNTAVLSVLRDGQRVIGVTTPRGAIYTSCVVNAAGIWAAQIGKLVDYTLPVTVVRQQEFSVSSLVTFPAEAPTVLFPDENFGLYAQGSSVTFGATDRTGQAESAQEIYSTALESGLITRAVRRIPEIKTAHINRQLVGLYDLTPDDLPLLGRVPQLEGFYCITGFNGHGFMHAPACGLLLSEEILYGHIRSLESSALHVSRFQARQEE